MNRFAINWCVEIKLQVHSVSKTQLKTISARSILLQVVGIEYAHTLTETTALHMRAKQTCTDALGKKRLAHNSLTSTLTSITFEITILNI